MEYYKNLNLQDILYVNPQGIESVEEWRDIPDYVGYYQASILGRIKSLKFRGTDKQGILKQSSSAFNAISVSLCKNNKAKKFEAHILIAMAFLNHKPCGLKLIVDHIFENRKDNRAWMLQLITQRNNISKRKKISSSEFVGVYFHKNHKKWLSAIRIEDKKYHLGAFDNELEASEKYQETLKNWDDFKIKPSPKKFGSQYKGVTFFKARNKWVAKIKINGKLTHIGIYKTELEAHYAFEEALLLNPDATA